MTLPSRSNIKENIVYLRNKVASVASLLNAHIGSSESHEVADTTRAGFMSPTQYNDVTFQLPTLLNQLNTIIASTRVIPAGTLVWFYGKETDIPDGWEIATNKEYLPMYNSGRTSRGTSLYGLDINSSLSAGDINTTKSVIDPEGIVKTVALYLLRKKDTVAKETTAEMAYKNARTPSSGDGVTYLPKGPKPTDNYNTLEYEFVTVPAMDIRTEASSTYTFIKPQHANILRILVGNNEYYFQADDAQRTITVKRSFSGYNGKIEIECNGFTNYLYNVTTTGYNTAKVFAATGLVRIEWVGNYNHYYNKVIGSLEVL